MIGNIGKKRNIRKTSKTAILLLLTVFLVLGWNLLGKATYDEILGLHEQLSLMRQEETDLKMLIDQKVELELKWSGWQEQKDYLNRAIPSNAEIPFVLVSLEELLMNLPVNVQEFSASDTSNPLGYSSTTLKISIAGSQDQIQEAFRCLDEFPSLLLIDSLAWNKTSEKEVRLDLKIRLISMETEVHSRNNLTRKEVFYVATVPF